MTLFIWGDESRGRSITVVLSLKQILLGFRWDLDPWCNQIIFHLIFLNVYLQWFK
jgi:hypothetical protein